MTKEFSYMACSTSAFGRFFGSLGFVVLPPEMVTAYRLSCGYIVDSAGLRSANPQKWHWGGSTRHLSCQHLPATGLLVAGWLTQRKAKPTGQHPGFLDVFAPTTLGPTMTQELVEPTRVDLKCQTNAPSRASQKRKPVLLNKWTTSWPWQMGLRWRQMGPNSSQ